MHSVFADNTLAPCSPQFTWTRSSHFATPLLISDWGGTMWSSADGDKVAADYNGGTVYKLVPAVNGRTNPEWHFGGSIHTPRYGLQFQHWYGQLCQKWTAMPGTDTSLVSTPVIPQLSGTSSTSPVHLLKSHIWFNYPCYFLFLITCFHSN